MTIERWDPLAPPDWNDPYRDYARLREQAPVHWAPDTGAYCVSRYEDVARVLRDTERFSSRGAFEIVMKRHRIRWRDAGAIARFLWRAGINPMRRPDRAASGLLITVDPPRHTDLRAMVNRGFTPRRVRDIEPRRRARAAAAPEPTSHRVQGCGGAGIRCEQRRYELGRFKRGVATADSHRNDRAGRAA